MESEERNVEDCWLVSGCFSCCCGLVFHEASFWFFFFLYFHVFPLLYYLKIAMVFMRA